MDKIKEFVKNAISTVRNSEPMSRCGIVVLILCLIGVFCCTMTGKGLLGIMLFCLAGISSIFIIGGMIK